MGRRSGTLIRELLGLISPYTHANLVPLHADLGLVTPEHNIPEGLVLDDIYVIEGLSFLLIFFLDERQFSRNARAQSYLLDPAANNLF